MKPRLVYFATADWYFCSHRLPLARAASAAGFDVHVVTNVESHGELITGAGLSLVPLTLERGGLRPFAEARTLFQLVRVLRKLKPDILHNVSLKPILYGCLASSLVDVPCVVNALTGLGYVFTSRERLARALRPPTETLLRRFLNQSGRRTIVQNTDDLSMLADRGILERHNSVLIRGSGVDLKQFSVSPEPAGAPVVVFPARLLRDKGLLEFVAAARAMRERGVRARFVLAGALDPDNPSNVTEAQTRQWCDAGWVEWIGFREDMAQVFREAHVVCLPSYREGLPKALLEAAACARPLVATDVPGCREIVRDGQNGILVPARDPAALAGALERLIDDPALRARYGAASRHIASTEFSVETVCDQTLRVYRELLAGACARQSEGNSSCNTSSR